MADEDNEIPISFVISGQNDLLALQLKLIDTFDAIAKVTGATNPMGKAFQAAASSVRAYNQTITELAKGGVAQRGLNADATAAANTARAFKELTAAKLESDEALRSAINSGDIDQISLAAKALERDIARMSIALKEMENLGAQADQAAIEALTRRLEVAEANARSAREALASAQREAGIQRRVAGKEDTGEVNQRYGQTAAGQAAQQAAAARQEADAYRENARRDAKVAQAAADEAEARDAAQAKFEQSFTVDQAKAEDKDRTAFSRDETQAYLIEARRNLAAALAEEAAAEKAFSEQEAFEHSLMLDAAKAEAAARKQAADIAARDQARAEKAAEDQRTKFQAQADRAKVMNATGYDPEFLAAKKTSGAQLRGDTYDALTPEQEQAIAAANVARRQSASRIKAHEDAISPPPPPPPPKDKPEELPDDGGFSTLAFQARIQAQYYLINELFGAYGRLQEAVVEFDKNMTNLGAVTGASNTQLQSLRDTIIDVSTKTPFSANELAKASTNLAEKGVSAGEITSALPNIANLAGATGSTVDQSAEIFSAAFDNFKLSGAGSAAVADQLTVALNKTRLSAENFDQAIQSAQEASKTAGLSFTEMNAALGSMANQGLRTGSLLGTALTAVLTDLQDPPKKLADRFTELGLTQDQLNVKSNTLTGVLDNLKAAGFTAADAFDTLGARQAKGLAALLDGTDGNRKLYDAMMNSQGAALITSERMESLGNTYKALGNTMFGITENASRPLLDALKELGFGFTTLIGGVNGSSAAFTVLGTVLESLVAGSALTWIGTKMVAAWRAYAASAVLASAATEGAEVAVVGFGAVLSGPIGIAIALGAAIATLVGGLAALEHSALAAANSQKELVDASVQASDAVSDQSKALDKLNDFYLQCVERSGNLTTGSDALKRQVEELQSQFGGLTGSVYGTINSYDQLLGKITEVRTEIQSGMSVALAAQGIALQEQLKGAQGTLNAQQQAEHVANFATKMGVVGDDTDGGNSIDQQAVSAVQTGGADVAKTLQRLYAKALADPNYDPAHLAALKTEMQTAASATMSQGAAQQGIVENTQAKGVNDYLASSQYASIRNDNTPMLVEASKALDSVSRNSDAQAAGVQLTEVATTINETFKSIRDKVAKLDDAQKAAFAKSPTAALMTELSSKLSEMKDTVGDKVAKAAVTAASDAVKETSAEMALYTEKMRLDKGAAKGADFDAFKAAAAKNHQYELDSITAKYDALKKNGVLTADLMHNEAIEIETQNVKYQDELLHAQATDSRVAHGHADPNRVIAAPPTDYALADKNALTGIDDTATNAASASKDGLGYDEAYLNTEKAQPGASKVDIKKREEALAKARLAMEQQELDAYNAQVTSLEELYAKTEGDISTTTAAVNQLLTSNGVTKDAQGNLDPTSFANASARGDFKAKYDALEKQLKELQAVVVDINAKAHTAQTSASNLQGQVDARNSVPAPSFLGTAQNAVNDFNGPGGDSMFSMASEGSDIKSIMDGAQKSTASFFSTIENGSQRGQNAFRQMAMSMITDMENILNQQLSKQLIGMLGNAAIDLLGGGSSTTSLPGTDIGGLESIIPTVSLAPSAYRGSSAPGRERRDEKVPMPPGAPTRVLHFFAGGAVPGADVGRDSVPALLAGGESVLNREATSMLGAGMIDSLNAGVMRKGAPGKAAPAPAARQEMNVWVVDKSATPQMGPRDVLATIGEDIRNNGTTRKLISQVINGG